MIAPVLILLIKLYTFMRRNSTQEEHIYIELRFILYYYTIHLKEAYNIYKGEVYACEQWA